MANKSKGLLKILKESFNYLKNRIAALFKNYKQKKKDSSKNDDSVENQKTENELLRKINLPASKNKLIFTNTGSGYDIDYNEFAADLYDFEPDVEIDTEYYDSLEKPTTIAMKEYAEDGLEYSYEEDEPEENDENVEADDDENII